jgi:hypothetical protein
MESSAVIEENLIKAAIMFKKKPRIIRELQTSPFSQEAPISYESTLHLDTGKAEPE